MQFICWCGIKQLGNERRKERKQMCVNRAIVGVMKKLNFWGFFLSFGIVGITCTYV
jgi:hypothetical protein